MKDKESIKQKEKSMKIIEGLFDNPYPPLRDKNGDYTEEVRKTIEAARELEADGVRAIVMACGFFSLIQDVLVEEVEIPVFTYRCCWYRCSPS